MLGNYLQQTTSADDIFRCIFRGALRVKIINTVEETNEHFADDTVVLTKSDSDVIFCSQLLSKPLTCTLHLS